MAIEPIDQNMPLLAIAQQLTMQLFGVENPTKPLYNLAHAGQIADAAQVMLALQPQPDADSEIILAAAWLCTIASTQHPHSFPAASLPLAEQSAVLATKLLTEHGVDPAQVAAIHKLILVTSGHSTPTNPAEAIVHDACTHHYSHPNFRDDLKGWYKVDVRLGITHLDYLGWRQQLVAQLQAHRYQTTYGKAVLENKKTTHLQKIQAKVERKMSIAAEADDVLEVEPTPEAEPLPESDVDADLNSESLNVPKDKDGNSKSFRSFETMFRITAPNNVRVSAMADDKAQIMINVNSIILSLGFGFMLKNLQTYPAFTFPTALLLAVNLATIVYAMLATRPKLSDGKFTQAQLDDKSVNLMWYGSFYNMSYDEYAKGVQKMMLDTTFLYNSLTKDIYWQGKVLGRKFKLLRIAYTIFMYGIVLVALAYAVAVYVEFWAK